MENLNQQSISISLPNPFYGISKTKNLIKEKIKGLFLSLSETASEGITHVSRASRFSNRVSMPRFNFKKKNVLRIALPVLVVVILAAAIFQLVRGSGSATVAGANTVANSAPIATIKLNKDFKFPLKDEAGKNAGEFSYTIESAEVRKQIIVKGQTATAVPGRVFLILNLKLVNALDKGLSINTRDYVRVSVEGDSKEWFAPDIHNDPVEAQAISTKYTRIGVAIDENIKNIKLQVGEIGGKKTEIPVSF